MITLFMHLSKITCTKPQLVWTLHSPTVLSSCTCCWTSCLEVTWDRQKCKIWWGWGWEKFWHIFVQIVLRSRPRYLFWIGHLRWAKIVRSINSCVLRNGSKNEREPTANKLRTCSSSGTFCTKKQKDLFYFIVIVIFARVYNEFILFVSLFIYFEI